MGKPTLPEIADSRAMRYAVLCETRPEWPEWKRCVEAGYSSRTRGLRNGRPVRHALELVEKHRDLLRTCPETSLGAMVAVLAGIVHGEAQESKDRINAVKQVSTMLGYDAPQKVEVRGTYLIQDFRSLGESDLADLREAVLSEVPQAEVVSGQGA